MPPYNFTEGRLDAPADAACVDSLVATLGVALPQDYLDFLKQHNGGDVLIGEEYFVFWQVQELAEFNRDYQVELYAPGIFLFGADGGGEGYGFDIEDAAMPIVRVPFIGMERQYAEPVAPSLTELFARSAP
ncbi:SMI1/KNR4 family protein [Pseudomonas fluorescens]|uniref:SMI1/KNR4 family protein n=1 Tax=Pseudomonas fluorescens TaxID=294 RepID=A0A1T2YRM3_PSEFL|nr:SMI1/KNR4 family protein [Pseudomonas fluorescens]OPA94851.1 SMI1/KNR4 family protein [Pseudomonas fluorescens]